LNRKLPWQGKMIARVAVRTLLVFTFIRHVDFPICNLTMLTLPRDKEYQRCRVDLFNYYTFYVLDSATHIPFDIFGKMIGWLNEK
jgi:hypothetical protein